MKFDIQFKNLIEKYSKDYQIDIFFHTFKSEILDEEKIINYYKPKAYKITKSLIMGYEKTQSQIGKNLLTSIQNVIELYLNYCKSNSVTHDIILMMRFDWFPPIELDINLLNPDNYNVFGIFYKNNKMRSDDNILFTSPDNITEYYNIVTTYLNQMIANKINVGNLHWIVGVLDKSKIFDMNNLKTNT